jgi:hypothetical protein
MEAAKRLYEFLNEEAEFEREMIEALEEQRTPEKPRFVIETTEQAIWALRKIARIEKERQEAREAAQLEKARIDEWLAAEEKRCDQARAHLDFLLEEYHRKILAENPKRKTIKLPHGTLELRKQPDEWAIDEEILVPWLMENRPELVVVPPPPKPKPDRNGIKKAFEVRDGRAVYADKETGEVVEVPGIEVHRRDLKFTVKVELPI